MNCPLSNLINCRVPLVGACNYLDKVNQPVPELNRYINCPCFKWMQKRDGMGGLIKEDV